MSDLWVIIPAAGESRRFKEAGFSIPKPFLNIKSQSGETHYMLDYVIDTIPKGYPIIIGLPKGVSLDRGNMSIQDCIEMVLDNAEHGGDKHYIQYIEETTGQADSVYQMIKHLPPNDSILVLDVDIVLQMLDVRRLIDMIGIYDVSIAVAETFDPNSSRVDQIPYPTRFVEKEPISQYGIVGGRAFRNIGLLQKALKRTLDRCATIHQEPYLSIAINHYPGTKFAHLVTQYIDWGTPERVKESGAEIIS